MNSQIASLSVVLKTKFGIVNSSIPISCRALSLNIHDVSKVYCTPDTTQGGVTPYQVRPHISQGKSPSGKVNYSSDRDSRKGKMRRCIIMGTSQPFCKGRRANFRKRRRVVWLISRRCQYSHSPGAIYAFLADHRGY
jgi:hypothetical protein